jgi:hypothetical protein
MLAQTDDLRLATLLEQPDQSSPLGGSIHPTGGRAGAWRAAPQRSPALTGTALQTDPQTSSSNVLIRFVTVSASELHTWRPMAERGATVRESRLFRCTPEERLHIGEFDGTLPGPWLTFDDKSGGRNRHPDTRCLSTMTGYPYKRSTSQTE